MISIRKRIASTVVSAIVVLGTLGFASGCGSSDDEAYPARPWVSPVDGKSYCAWVSTPHECEWSPWQPAPFPIPTDNSYHGGYGGDSHLFESLMLYHMATSSFYDRPGYYSRYIEPSYTRYPNDRVPHRFNSDTYSSASTKFYSKNKSKISTVSKATEYKTKSGKSLKSSDAQKKYFSGGNSKSGTSSSKSGSSFWSGGSKSSSGSKSGSSYSGSRSSGSSFSGRTR